MKAKKYMWWIVGGVFLSAATLWGPIVSNVEQAKYSVAISQDNIEIRDYSPMIIAEVEVSGKREEAINKGFRAIADYIFGNNTSSQKIAMTAPVQQTSEKIAMTAPVKQEGEGSDWKVSFVMPSSYNMQTLPKPNNDLVKLREITGKRFAVIRFSGLAGEESLNKHSEELNAFINSKKLNVISKQIYAFYNPPWTMPFLRRNEIMVEIAR
ncbi:MAG: heme-binding protein [Pseudomonadota bacterium]